MVRRDERFDNLGNQEGRDFSRSLGEADRRCGSEHQIDFCSELKGSIQPIERWHQPGSVPTK